MPISGFAHSFRLQIVFLPTRCSYRPVTPSLSLSDRSPAVVVHVDKYSKVSLRAHLKKLRYNHLTRRCRLLSHFDNLLVSYLLSNTHVFHVSLTHRSITSLLQRVIDTSTGLHIHWPHYTWIPRSPYPLVPLRLSPFVPRLLVTLCRSFTYVSSVCPSPFAVAQRSELYS